MNLSLCANYDHRITNITMPSAKIVNFGVVVAGIVGFVQWMAWLQFIQCKEHLPYLITELSLPRSTIFSHLKGLATQNIIKND